MESITPSEIVLVRRTYSSFRRRNGLRFSPTFCSCSKGNSPKASVSSGTYLSKKDLDPVNQEKLAVGNYGYQMNGTDSSLFRKNVRILDGIDDEYGGVVVDPQHLPSNPNVFTSMLRFSLSHWKTQEKKGVWLKLPVELSELVPIAVKEGFEYHHAERGYVMLTYWIPDGPSLLPANASHQVGVGGFVVNDKNEVLVVQEKYCAPAFSGLWKLPTGFIHESEEIFNGAVREVREETGVDTEFVEVIAFRHAHDVAFQKSDLFFVCMLKPLSTDIVVDDLEVQAAMWMPLVEFVEQPLIRGDCMFKKVMDICIARMGKHYCGLSPHRLVSAFDGQPSSLYYNVVDTQGTNCITN